MKIQVKALEIKECGPLRDVEISFMSNGQPRPVTVIGGANGSGKTTILALIFALVNMFGRKSQAVSQVSQPVRQAKLYESILDRSNEAKMQLLVNDTDVDLHFVNDEYLYDATDDVSRLTEAIKKQTGETLELFSPHIPSPNIQFDAPSILYFPDYRSLKPAVGQPIVGQELNREDVLYKWTHQYQVINSFKGSLDSYLVWLEYAYPDQFATAKDYLNEIILVDKAIDAVNRPELTTMIKLADGQRHRLDELSSGEQNLLIIMLELRRRLLPGSVVLIDEIENSLHPAFQYRLAEALLKLQQKIPFQLIVTTHASAFLDIFGAESTLLLTEF